MNAATRLRAALAAALTTALVVAVVPPAQAADPDRTSVIDAATDLQAWRGTATPRDAELSAWATGPDVVPGQLIVTAATDGGASFQSFAADRYERATELAPGITAVHVDPGRRPPPPPSCAPAPTSPPSSPTGSASSRPSPTTRCTPSSGPTRPPASRPRGT